MSSRTSSCFKWSGAEKSSRGSKGSVYYGDYYATPPLGGNVGGRGNVNTITGSGPVSIREPIQSRLDRIGGMIAVMKLDITECEDLLEELGEIEKMIREVEEECDEYVSKLKKKVEDLQITEDHDVVMG